jgi:hypothetical protein
MAFDAGAGEVESPQGSDELIQAGWRAGKSAEYGTKPAAVKPVAQHVPSAPFAKDQPLIGAEVDEDGDREEIQGSLP